MKRRALFALLFAATFAGTFTAARALSVQIASIGAFALQGAASHINAQMVATAQDSPLGWDLQFSFAHTGARIAIAEYDRAGNTPMHLIVVDDAMQSFQHLHPRLDSAGTFHQRITFPKSGYYHVYADTTPSGSERQLFRFDFVGGSLQSRPPPRKLKTSPPGAVAVAAGPYRVTFTVPALHTGTPATIVVRIPPSSAPVDATMISARDLSYAVVQAETAGPGMMRLHVTPRVRGAYKLWLQFADARGTTYVVPLALAVR